MQIENKFSHQRWGVPVCMQKGEVILCDLLDILVGGLTVLRTMPLKKITPKCEANGEVGMV